MEYKIEENIAQKFYLLQEARENQHALLFDEMVKSIAILFKAKPLAHQEFMNEKEGLDKELIEMMQGIDYAATQAADAIYKQAIINEKVPLQWQYRETIEEIIIEIMEKYNLIPMKESKPAKVEPVLDEAPFEPIPEATPAPAPTPEPKKPKFLKKLMPKPTPKPAPEEDESFTV